MLIALVSPTSIGSEINNASSGSRLEMEFSLHRQLKEAYSSSRSKMEVDVDGYRIDVVKGKTLIEIQASSLVSIRDKIQKLVEQYQVLVVKPIVQRKWIIRLDKKGGEVLSRRLSPKKGNALTAFEELVYLTRLFPHPRLTLELPLVSVEEYRFPGHGRRRWRRENDFVIDDIQLVERGESFRIKQPHHLLSLLPSRKFPKEFTTQHLAKSASIHRSDAQRIAYTLRETGAIEACGKEGNAILYRIAKPSRAEKKSKPTRRPSRKTLASS